MDFQVKYDEELNCVVGKLTGDLTLDVLKAYVTEISSVAKLHPCWRFLNDMRSANIPMPILEVYQAMNELTPEGFDSRWKRAVLIKPPYDEEKMKFFESAAYVRRIAIKTFVDYDEAMEWLNIE